MKKIPLFLAAVLLLQACVSSEKMAKFERTLYLGIDSSGYITTDGELFAGPKELLGGIKNGEVVTPSFPIPEDVLFIEQSQLYNHRLTDGTVIYKQEKLSRQWMKVAFIPYACVIEGLSSGDFIKVTLSRGRQTAIVVKYYWRESTSSFAGRWIRK